MFVVNRVILCGLVAWEMALATAGAQVEQRGLRLIAVSTEAEAVDLRARVRAGDSFEFLAREYSIDASAPAGGYLGLANSADLRPEFRAALAGLPADDVSPAIRIGNEFFLLQWVPPEEEIWQDTIEAAFDAFNLERYAEAATLFRDAVLAAEAFDGTEDERLVRSLAGLAETHRLQGNYAEAEPLYERALAILETTYETKNADFTLILNNLAETHRLQGDYAEAEPLYGRALAILETTPGTDDADLATILSNLAETYSLAGQYEEAEPLYRRALAIMEEVWGPEHSEVIQRLRSLAEILQERERYTEAARLYERILSARWDQPAGGEGGRLIPVLESLAAVLSLAYFPDTEREEAYGEYIRALGMATLGENLYPAMTKMLFSIELPEEAEHVALDAVGRFPDSRESRIELAALYEDADNLARALEVFEEASQIEGPPGVDSSLDRYRRGYIQNRIGRLSILSGRFDDAIRAYRRTLEVVPEDAIAHTSLGDLYLGRDMLDEALAEYKIAIEAHPENAEAYHGIAGVHLRLGQFAEATTAAGHALELDPEHPRALYVRAMAEIRAGQDAEGQRDLDVYRQREAESQAAANRQLQIGVSNRDATALLVEGRTDEAIRLFRDSIDAQPDAWFFLMLGVSRSKLGQHEAAIEAFREILDLELGISFLAHWNLAREYDALGDVPNSERHRAVYLRDYDTELEARLH